VYKESFSIPFLEPLTGPNSLKVGGIMSDLSQEYHGIPALGTWIQGNSIEQT
jgi:hypothetical protein